MQEQLGRNIAREVLAKEKHATMVRATQEHLRQEDAMWEHVMQKKQCDERANDA